jgi:hypothetical protein
MAKVEVYKCDVCGKFIDEVYKINLDFIDAKETFEVCEECMEAVLKTISNRMNKNKDKFQGEESNKKEQEQIEEVEVGVDTSVSNIVTIDDVNNSDNDYADVYLYVDVNNVKDLHLLYAALTSMLPYINDKRLKEVILSLVDVIARKIEN